ncbi:6457_t:CDS:2, partial [Acaulospora colombiana]
SKSSDEEKTEAFAFDAIGEATPSRVDRNVPWLVENLGIQALTPVIIVSSMAPQSPSKRGNPPSSVRG